MKKKLAIFSTGLLLVLTAGAVYAGCIQDCRAALADCIEDGGSNCTAKLAACRAACG